MNNLGYYQDFCINDVIVKNLNGQSLDRMEEKSYNRNELNLKNNHPGK